MIPNVLKPSPSKCNHQRPNQFKRNLSANHNHYRAVSDPVDASILANHSFDPRQTASPLIGPKNYNKTAVKPPKLSTFQSSNSKLNNFPSRQSDIHDSGISIPDTNPIKKFSPSPRTAANGAVHFPVPENDVL